jgi:hypothetical protein
MLGVLLMKLSKKNNKSIMYIGSNVEYKIIWKIQTTNLKKRPHEEMMIVFCFNVSSFVQAFEVVLFFFLDLLQYAQLILAIFET